MGRQQRGSTVGRTDGLEHGGDDLADLVFGLAGGPDPEGADESGARPARPLAGETVVLEAVPPLDEDEPDDAAGARSASPVADEPAVVTPPRGTRVPRSRFVGPSLDQVVEPGVPATMVVSPVPLGPVPEPAPVVGPQLGPHARGRSATGAADRPEPVVVPGSSVPPEPVVAPGSSGPVEPEVVPPVVVEPVRVVRPSAELVVVPDPAQRRPAATGWRGFLRRATRGVIDLEPGPRERAVIEAATAVRTRWQGPRTVVVANPKGGSGKTPTAIGLAATFGHVRGGGVLAWDANETLGTLGLRTEGTATPATVVDLLEKLDEFESRGARRGDLGAVVRAQESGNFHVLPSDEDPRRMSQIDAAGFARLHDVLQRYYDVLVVDTGNNPRAEGFMAALAVADALVIPVSWAEDKVVTAGRLVDQLREMGRDDLVERAVTVVTGPWGAGTTPAQVRSWKAWFEEQTAAVVQIPTDARIGGGGPIVYDELGAATRRSYLFAASHVSGVFSALGPATSDLLSAER